eukprot:CAMPEP_0181104900 /NCGR_PEP_ID=MMETSP1071-20121207/15679_1 /TAXON_ID=35127 /ORGANISM="Thalassiosira sp., Strain NH16" /LENGTH=248 /DNA_ID=CAMNT_0023188139 /DNA_START=471 /DNA_END=1214 /DNA_ORIENTATION=+
MDGQGVDDSITETVEDFLEEAIETVRVFHGNSSIWRGEGKPSRSVLGQRRNDSSSLMTSNEGEKTPPKPSSTAGSSRLCLSTKRSSAAVAGKSQLSPRDLDDRDGKWGRLIDSSPSAAASGATTATCDVAGDMSLATEDDGAFGSCCGGVDESSFDDAAAAPAAGKNFGSNGNGGSMMAFSSSQKQQTGEHDEDEDESVEIALCRFTRLCNELEFNGASLPAPACWSKPTIDDKSSQWIERLMPNFRW